MIPLANNRFSDVFLDALVQPADPSALAAFSASFLANLGRGSRNYAREEEVPSRQDDHPLWVP